VREELIRAAEELLVERGSSDAVTVAQIVGRVGVTAPVLYMHFEDKDDLFFAVHLRRMDQFREALRRAARSASSPLDALERRGRAYVRFAISRSDAYRALFMTPNQMAVEAFANPETRRLSAYDDLVDNIQACMDDGSIPPGDADFEARIVWAQVHGLASVLITMPALADDVGVDALVDRLLRGVTSSLVAG
jgi:AcrR family transcriptional regulator